eukprot:GHRR01019864.1.p1 GENE.GHRR01019864.1~~GHRR01019864.1.p1  ORF type:complete len:328 (+),score=133.17 GHRR01019864.1:1233-2216(+)
MPPHLPPGGQWIAHLAGGRSCHPTWGSNPQYLITCQRETTAVIALLRPDVRNSLMALPYNPDECIGITVCTAEVTADGLGRRCAVRQPAAEVYAESEFASMDEAVLLVRLQPEVPYVVVPSTAGPGVQAPYELRLFSSQPLELVPMPEVQCVSHTGAWTAGSAGGCNLHQSWITNPAYLLQLPAKTTCRICLARSTGNWPRNQSLRAMIGFYIIRAAPPRGQQHTVTSLKQLQLYESAFVPMATCEEEVDLPGNMPLLLVPCTYASGVRGKFVVSVTASSSFSFEALTAGLADAAAKALEFDQQQAAANTFSQTGNFAAARLPALHE